MPASNNRFRCIPGWMNGRVDQPGREATEVLLVFDRKLVLRQVLVRELPGHQAGGWELPAPRVRLAGIEALAFCCCQRHRIGPDWRNTVRAKRTRGAGSSHPPA